MKAKRRLKIHKKKVEKYERIIATFKAGMTYYLDKDASDEEQKLFDWEQVHIDLVLKID